jgi:hypothetical protein
VCQAGREMVDNFASIGIGIGSDTKLNYCDFATGRDDTCSCHVTQARDLEFQINTLVSRQIVHEISRNTANLQESFSEVVVCANMPVRSAAEHLLGH